VFIGADCFTGDLRPLVLQLLAPILYPWQSIGWYHLLLAQPLPDHEECVDRDLGLSESARPALGINFDCAVVVFGESPPHLFHVCRLDARPGGVRAEQTFEAPSRAPYLLPAGLVR
jgi:hypothetical protein